MPGMNKKELQAENDSLRGALQDAAETINDALYDGDDGADDGDDGDDGEDE